MRILVAEDEVLTRESIVDKLRGLGWLDIAQAADGVEALELLPEFLPDVVLTDIRMPRMDAMAFIEKAKEILPNAVYVIISGYGMFEYAQQAIKLGVYAYLLKPIKDNELRGIMDAIAELLERPGYDRDNNVEYEIITRKYREISQRKFILDLSEGMLSDADYIHSFARECGLQVSGSDFLIVKVFFDGYPNLSGGLSHKELSAIKYGIENITLELLPEDVSGFPFDFSEGCGFLVNLNRQMIKKLEESFYKIKNAVSNNLKITVTVCIGEMVGDLIQLNRSALSVSDLILSRIVKGGDQVYISQDSKIRRPAVSPDDEGRIAGALRAGNIEEVMNLIRSVYSDAMQKGVTGPELSKVHFSIILTIYDILEGMHAPVCKKFGSEISVYNHIKRITELNDIYLFFESAIAGVPQYLEESGQAPNQRLMGKAMDFIIQNYTHDIGLNDVAAHCNLSPSYCSKMFKEEYGENFINFLIKYRIQKAIELLNGTSLHVNEISEAVGFRDIKYFHRSFKKIVGIPPGKYRKYAPNNDMDYQ